MGFELVEASVLQVFKGPIPELAGLADHYYLAETSNHHHSVGWGASGLELRGSVRITSLELERVERFMAAAKYSIAVNNCEHFVNYVLHGINLSSQQHLWWKCLGAEVISLLQPVQSIGGSTALPGRSNQQQGAIAIDCAYFQDVGLVRRTFQSRHY